VLDDLLADDAIGFDNIFHSRPRCGIVQCVRDLAQAVKARFESLMILVQIPGCRRWHRVPGAPGLGSAPEAH
jgi:hypothetical protein